MNKNYDSKGYYRLLDVQYDAPLELIKKHYYEKAKIWHPDHNENSDSLDMFQKISVAYDILQDEKKRIVYDLLCLIYDENDFPQIGSLKIYKNQKDRDDIALRVLRRWKVIKTKSGYELQMTKDICNFYEALELVTESSFAVWKNLNWFCGAAKKNLEVIKKNAAALPTYDADNLQLFIHNAVAYEQENKHDYAFIYAKQALQLSRNDYRAQELLNRFIGLLNYSQLQEISLPQWSVSALRKRQKLVPLTFSVIMAFLLFGSLLQPLLAIHLPTKSDDYYVQRQLGDVITADDMTDSHIIRIDGDIDTTDYLYHLQKDAVIYHGPDERYDKMADIKDNTTVRVIGYTPNRKWLKIMLANGETGFLPQNVLEKGIGNPLPARSAIYRK
jgi:curved DNA-binding protein CbpA